MKKTLIYCAVVLLCTLVIAVIPTEADSAVYEDTVRLHILANSNSDEDQALKLRIRDDILLEFSDMLSSYENSESAKYAILTKLDEIDDFAERKILEYGYSYSVEVTLTEEWYDTRSYENFTLPKGSYTSLRVIIGEGEGQNWWCVMFPPICLDIATENASGGDAVKKYSDNEFTLISGNGYQAKFKILELVSSVFQ